MEKHNALASKQGIKHTIKGGKPFADSIIDSAQISNLLKDYYIKYGKDKFTQLLISSYTHIKGGISFNNGREQLSNDILKLILK